VVVFRTAGLRDRPLSGTLVTEMPEHHDVTQPGGSIDKWPTFPSAPSGGRLLLGVAYLTTAAIYVAYLVNTADLGQPATWVAPTTLFALFALSIHFFHKSYEHFWRRLGAVLFQVALVFAGVIFSQDTYTPILCFIVVPMAYLSFTFLQATGLTLLCLGALLLAYLIVGDVSAGLALLLPYGGGFVFFATISTILVRQQNEWQRAERLLAELEDAHRQLQAYAVQVESLAVAEERNRLAREIHDSLGHYLTAITMQLEAAGKLVATQPEQAAESIAKAEEMARESLAEVRRSVAALRTSPLDAAALGDAIGEIVENLRDGGIATTFTIAGQVRPLPIQSKMTLYRAAQEGLTNVRKHANASAVEVTLAHQPEQVTLTIVDNGTGRRGGKNEGFGLLGLHERVTLLGGTLEAGDDPTGGFRLHIAIPTGEEQDG
jgi:signal transduction histidine kinase